MKANETKIETFLSSNKTQFVIPVYQRNYDWNKIQCEQLFNDIAASYPNVQEYVWAQEEPKNQGAWSYLMPILSEILDTRIKYIGRAASAASASASYKLHQVEQARIVEEALRYTSL